MVLPLRLALLPGYSLSVYGKSGCGFMAYFRFQLYEVRRQLRKTCVSFYIKYLTRKLIYRKIYTEGDFYGL